MAPIPFVGPFVEVGLGLSVGSIRTRLGALGAYSGVDESHTGVMPHVPLSLGLAFGRRHQHQPAVGYYAHPTRDHGTGWLSIGIGL